MVQESAKSRPRGSQGSQNGVPKSCFFVSFSGPVFGPFSGLPFGWFLGCLVSPKLGFCLGGPTKTLLPPGRLQERKNADKVAKTGPEIYQKTTKTGAQKGGPKIKRNLPPGPPQGSAECGPKIREPPRLQRNFGPRGRNIGGGNHMVAEKPHSLVAPDRAGAGG